MIAKRRSCRIIVREAVILIAIVSYYLDTDTQFEGVHNVQVDKVSAFGSYTVIPPNVTPNCVPAASLESKFRGTFLGAPQPQNISSAPAN